MACVAGIARAETFTAQYKNNERYVQVVRHYEVQVEPGKPVRVLLPAMLSFWGATNSQVITKSKFKYSESPDDVKDYADNLGMPRRYYQCTWRTPKSGQLTVDQTLDIQLTMSNKLFTSAQLPYPDEILKRFPGSFGKDEKEGIDPDNDRLPPICEQILKRSHTAEATVEGVCDWVNENIQFVMGVRGNTEETLVSGQGSCTPMSRVACSMLRHIGIPAEIVSGKFIGSDGGHSFIEVYFPDAGWVFYDLSNGSRGFKSLDCLTTVGYSYQILTLPRRQQWVNGDFCQERNPAPFDDGFARPPKLVRKIPSGHQVITATVLSQKAPASVTLRHRPLRELILDTSIAPGSRPPSDDAGK